MLVRIGAAEPAVFSCSGAPPTKKRPCLLSKIILCKRPAQSSARSSSVWHASCRSLCTRLKDLCLTLSYSAAPGNASVFCAFLTGKYSPRNKAKDARPLERPGKFHRFLSICEMIVRSILQGMKKPPGTSPGGFPFVKASLSVILSEAKDLPASDLRILCRACTLRAHRPPQDDRSIIIPELVLGDVRVAFLARIGHLVIAALRT